MKITRGQARRDPNEVLQAAVGLIAMFPFAWLTKRFFVDKIGTLGHGTWDIKPKFW